jgi:hypothetical protein
VIKGFGCRRELLVKKTLVAFFKVFKMVSLCLMANFIMMTLWLSLMSSRLSVVTAVMILEVLSVSLIAMTAMAMFVGKNLILLYLALVILILGALEFVFILAIVLVLRRSFNAI